MVAHSGHAEVTPAQDMGGMGDMFGHGAMSMVFFTSTSTPLFSNAWTPTTAGAYAGTCIFLIILAALFRALFTAQSFLSHRAIKHAMQRRYVVVEGAGAEKITSDASSTTGILTTNGIAENVRLAEAPVQHIQPWRFSVDLPRSAVVTVTAGVGYLLMLAVMTFNVGYFLSVLAGTFLGEMAFGRYYQYGTHM